LTEPADDTARPGETAEADSPGRGTRVGPARISWPA